MSKVPAGWTERVFGDVTTFANGLVDPKVEPYASGKHIGPENVQSHSGKISDVKLCKELGLISGKYEFDENCVVYSKIRPNLNKVCKPSFQGVCSADMYPIWANKDLNIDYLFHFMLSDNFVSRAISVSMRTGMPKINRADLTAFPISLPPLPEQTKIAQILSTWDKAIATTEKLIGNSQQQKKALMQSLLTGKKRLPGFEKSNEYQTTRYGKIPLDWGFKQIDDCAKNISIKNKEGKDYPVLSCSKHSGFIDSLKYFNKKVYSDNTDGYKIIKKGWFGFPSNHIEEGSIGLQDLYEVGIVSPIYIIFGVNEKFISSLYLYALFKTDHYKQIFSASTNASVDRRGSLRWDEFGKIKVPVPPLPEQQKIAAVLTAADNEIELLQKKLAFLKQEKTALMQQLLTGKRRVKINATEECMDA